VAPVAGAQSPVRRRWAVAPQRLETTVGCAAATPTLGRSLPHADRYIPTVPDGRRHGRVRDEADPTGNPRARPRPPSPAGRARALRRPRARPSQRTLLMEFGGVERGRQSAGAAIISRTSANECGRAALNCQGSPRTRGPRDAVEWPGAAGTGRPLQKRGSGLVLQGPVARCRNKEVAWRCRDRSPAEETGRAPKRYRPTGCSTSKPANSPPPCAQRVPSSAWATVSKRQPAIVIQTWSALE
jgi:hypothetical protein